MRAAGMVVFALSIASSRASAAGPAVDGDYDSPLGRVRVSGDGATYRGVLLEPAERCAFRAGEEVLRATLLDDSLAGQVRVCLRGKSCRSAEQWASSVLLVQEARLSGAVHVAAKGCAGPVGRRGGIAFERVGAVDNGPTAPPTSTATPTPTPTPTSTAPPTSTATPTPTATATPTSTSTATPTSTATATSTATSTSTTTTSTSKGASTSTPTRRDSPLPRVGGGEGQGEGAHATSPRRGNAREQARAMMRDGAGYLQEGNFEAARRRFLDAIEIDARIPEAYNGVGVTFRMRNDLPRALDWYKKALAVDPDFGDAYYNMACVYALRGEKEMALRYLQIAALNGYATAEGIGQDPDLDPIREEPGYRALVRAKM